MAFSSCDLNEAVCISLERAGLARFDLADDDESTNNIRAANAVDKALSDREALRRMLKQLIEHDAASGRSEARVWRRARALYRATARKV